jgi:tetratricopeptide (TPR) repeat protein
MSAHIGFVWRQGHVASLLGIGHHRIGRSGISALTGGDDGTNYTPRMPADMISHLERTCMNESSVNQLLEDLKKPDEAVRNRATQELWRIWFHQKGIYGLELIQRSQILLEAGEVAQAEAALTELINDQPDFAEAWNRRAVLYYTLGQYKKAIADCETVIKLNPVHFGALHGLGLCYAAIADYRAAIQAFRKALEIQPYALVNQRLILECTARL